ncbi:hypothetical protein [Chamaesiphon minutus]|uniref:hypothetical protein n=1 Tax=Chamaesiphon minutus TaxID=1173032 RepID=UPI0005A244F4|nr:hypothetical protein [Chamaesiphon minutus]
MTRSNAIDIFDSLELLMSAAKNRDRRMPTNLPDRKHSFGNLIELTIDLFVNAITILESQVGCQQPSDESEGTI